MNSLRATPLSAHYCNNTTTRKQIQYSATVLRCRRKLHQIIIQRYWWSASWWVTNYDTIHKRVSIKLWPEYGSNSICNLSIYMPGWYPSTGGVVKTRQAYTHPLLYMYKYILKIRYSGYSMEIRWNFQFRQIMWNSVLPEGSDSSRQANTQFLAYI